MKNKSEKQHLSVPSGDMRVVQTRIHSALKKLGVRAELAEQSETDVQQADSEETRLLSSPILLKEKLKRAISYVVDRSLASLVTAEARGQASMLDRKNAALTIAICTDKLLLLAGEATSRLALEARPAPSELGDLAARLARAAQQASLASAAEPSTLEALSQAGLDPPMD